MSQISFLLGSGFSKPDGILSVNEVNNIFTTIQKEYFDSVKSWYSNDIDYNYFTTFISTYQKINGSFNYEDFFDFAYCFEHEIDNMEVCKLSIKDFEKELLNKGYTREITGHRPDIFLMKFQLILAQLLTKNIYFDNAGFSDYGKYNGFIEILSSFIQNGDIIHVHTLNHDLLFEYIGNQHHTLCSYFCDGFTDFNSEFFENIETSHLFNNVKETPHSFYNVRKTHKVPLRYFNNCFLNTLRFYKLHGSIDTHVGNLGTRMFTENESLKQDFTRVKKDCFIGKIQKRLWLKELKNYYDSDTGFNFVPDFLTGSTIKKYSYHNDHYYATLFNHFEKNFKFSKKLIIIGYGGKDIGVNEIINKNFTGKLMCFDPNPQKELIDLCDKHNTSPTQRGIENIIDYKNELVN